jgi:hypothetical protein
MEMMNIPDLVDMAAAMKEDIGKLTEKLRQANIILAERATYKDGSKTGYADGRHFTAKVQKKENESWDQEKLEAARSTMGDPEFFRVFKWDFKPKNAKVLAGALEFGRHSALIEAARTVKPGAPQVSFETLEDC